MRSRDVVGREVGGGFILTLVVIGTRPPPPDTHNYEPFKPGREQVKENLPFVNFLNNSFIEV